MCTKAMSYEKIFAGNNDINFYCYILDSGFRRIT